MGKLNGGEKFALTIFFGMWVAIIGFMFYAPQTYVPVKTGTAIVKAGRDNYIVPLYDGNDFVVGDCVYIEAAALTSSVDARIIGRVSPQACENAMSDVTPVGHVGYVLSVTKEPETK